MATLKKDLTVTGLTMIAIGSCIGSGIFVTPASIAQQLPHHGLILLAWVLGGLVSYAGALVFSELSARYPQAGGVYVYLKEAFGELVGFLYGWVILLIINTGALAALAMALADYMTFFIEFTQVQKMIFSCTVVVFLTILNVFGVNISQIFAKLFTSLKLLALSVLVIIGLAYFGSTEHSLDIATSFVSSMNPLQAFLLAFVGVFWSFGGWHHTTYLSAEAKNAQRTVPRAMLFGTMIVTLVYLLTNLAYMSLLPLDEIANSQKVAGDALNVLLPQGGKIITVVIAISIFGTIGIYTMTAPRIYYAMAKDKVFFPALAKVHDRYRTPVFAMLAQMIWAVALILFWGSFLKLITFVTFMDIVFMALAAMTLFVFRRKSNKVSHQGFKTPLYPLIPLFYLLITIAFVINTLSTLSMEAWIGVGILILGIPVFYYFKRSQ